MSNLAERLRRRANHIATNADLGATTWEDIYAEAAVEIERLQSDLAKSRVLLESAVARINHMMLALQQIEGAALRNNGPLASDHTLEMR